MQITNRLLSRSFEYNEVVGKISDRFCELTQLDEILDYCKRIDEDVYYGDFMESCFPNSIFAVNCKNELRYIKDFEKYTSEITKCLSVLDMEVIKLYDKNRDNLNYVVSELQSKMKNTVGALQDPKHRNELVFDFEIKIEEKNDSKVIEKKIECQPHFKLIRRDSDLRIYFYWRDDVIGNDKKVLIGQVGRHAW